MLKIILENSRFMRKFQNNFIRASAFFKILTKMYYKKLILIEDYLVSNEYWKQQTSILIMI